MSKEAIEIREKLAELCHSQWSGQIKYMFGKCLKKTDGTILIPEWAVTRWRRQAYTPYNKLSSQEKDSDRTEADKFINLLKQQPKAGEFTKECRAMAEVFLESTKNLTEKKLTELLESDWNGVGFIMRIYGTILEGKLAAKDSLEACNIIDRAEAINKDLLEELEKTNQCFKCKFGYRTSELICPGYADAELPCAGFKEYYDSNLALEAAIAKAKKEG